MTETRADDTPMEIGLLLLDEDAAPAVDVARAAEMAGLASVWTIDYYNRNSLVRAAAIAAATSEITVGTAVTPAFARAPLVTASAVADIQSIARGRFVFGLGSSTRRMNRDWFDTELDHPAPQLREAVLLIRELLAHQSGAYDFDGRFHRVHLAHYEHAPVGDEMKIFTAGVGEQMVQLAGEVADGFIGHPAASLDYMARVARPRIEAGRKRRADAAGDVRVALQVIAAIDEDRDAARRAVARQLGFYATVKGYDALFSDDDDVDRGAVRDAFIAGRPDDVGRLALPLTERRGAFGTADDVLATLEAYRDEVDLVILYSPHYGVSPAETQRNELALVDAVGRR